MNHSANMQTLVLNNLAMHLKDEGILPIAGNSVAELKGERRFTIDYGASNVGTIRIIEGHTLRELASITFDFQRNRFQFGVEGQVDPIASHTYGKARTATNSPWVCDTPLDALVRVVAHLAKRPKVAAA